MATLGVLGGIGMWWSRRALKRAGVGSPSEAVVNLQVIADTWEERYNLEHEARVAADLEVVQVKAERDALRRLLERRRSLRDPRRGS